MAAPFNAEDPVRVALERAIGFQYDILRLLGRGGMGAVYQAHERALDRPVAIKVLPPEVAATADARERFMREARTAARLTHPNIVPLLTFGETDGLVYYVMGYVDGESLQQLIHRSGKLDPNQASRILEQLASALDYAHKHGIVHRDVKPDNVLIERETGDAKLTDFGIAKRAAGGETLTGTGLLMGTPRYMSPEQASGDRDLDARSDVYSLGLVGYAMLAGKPPFDGGVQEILAQQVTQDAPSLRKMLPELASPIADGVERALRKDPKDRWQTAGALAQSLRGEEDEGGDLLKRIRRPGVFALTFGLTTAACWDFVWWMVQTIDHPSDWVGATIVASIFGLAPLVYALSQYAVLRWREKRPMSEIRRIFTEPPRWWPLWWPKAFRRTDDVWSRLPFGVRLTRLLSSAGFAQLLFGLNLGFLSLFAPPKADLPMGYLAATIGLCYGGLLTLGASIVANRWWSRKKGLSGEDARRMASEPTARPLFWAKPHIAKLLAPARNAERHAEPRSPKEIAEAMGAAASELPSSLHSMGVDAARAARQLVAALDALDSQIVQVASEADPEEFRRLEARLAALGAEAASDSVEKREMRKLYSSQLDLLRRLSRQRDELSARKTRYAELLRTLWLQVSALRAHHEADEARVADVTGMILDLCNSVQHEVDGANEATRLLQPETTPLPG